LVRGTDKDAFLAEDAVRNRQARSAGPVGRAYKTNERPMPRIDARAIGTAPPETAIKFFR
jgi:hypothetical protein